MSYLDATDRKRIRKSDFAYVDKDGEGHLPQGLPRCRRPYWRGRLGT